MPLNELEKKVLNVKNAIQFKILWVDMNTVLDTFYDEKKAKEQLALYKRANPEKTLKIQTV